MCYLNEKVTMMQVSINSSQSKSLWWWLPWSIANFLVDYLVNQTIFFYFCSSNRRYCFYGFVLENNHASCLLPWQMITVWLWSDCSKKIIKIISTIMFMCIVPDNINSTAFIILSHSLVISPFAISWMCKFRSFGLCYEL